MDEVLIEKFALNSNMNDVQSTNIDKKEQENNNVNSTNNFEDFEDESDVECPTSLQVNEDPYDPEKPFETRIYRAVENYNKKALNVMQQTILNKYLSFGGIKTGQKPFVDSTDKKGEEVDKDLKLGAAPDSDDDDTEVDFWSTIKDFMVENLILAPYSFEKEFHEETPNTIKKFLEFLVRAKVCPEYLNDIEASIKLCDEAKVELMKIDKMAKGYPDKFNISCSVVFGGNLFEFFKSSWTSIKDCESSIGVTVKEVNKFTDSWVKNGIKIDLAVCMDMSVESIVKEAVSCPPFDWNYFKIILKPFKHQSLEERFNYILSNYEVSSENYKPTIETSKLPNEFQLYISNDLLDFVFVGMVISGKFHKLSNGIWYLDSTDRIYPTFQFFDRPCT